MWKIDWETLEKLSENDFFNARLKDLVSDNTIVDIVYDDWIDEGRDILGITLENGSHIITGDKNLPEISKDVKFSSIVLISSQESDALIPMESHVENYYKFQGEHYETLEEVTKAIDSYADITKNPSKQYYYMHKTVKLYKHKVKPIEKIVGKFDQDTLDKVNKILKMKGIDLSIKGEES